MAEPLCSRCGTRPRVDGQRWCRECRNAAKRLARGTQRGIGGALGDTAGNREQPEAEGSDPLAGVVDGSFASPIKKARPGRKVPDGWQTRFLGYLRKHGTRWLAARQANVSHDSVTRYEHADPEFARKVHAALQEFADSLEENMTRLARRQDNVIGNIVLLKRHRPSEYIEKTVSLSLTATTELPAEDGRALLLAMFGQGVPGTLEQLEAAPPILPVRED